MEVIDKGTTLMHAKDMVIIYKSHDEMDMIQLEEESKKSIYNCKLGSFPHTFFIGKPYGSQIWSADRKKYLYALKPTPQLITASLSHRTQILYAPDISFIVSSLEMINGSIVVESGTGSGSLSTSIARAIAPKGHLYTYEFNSERAQQAHKDFVKYGLSDVITVNCRDAVKDGFMHEPKMSHLADAVFLDLPNPWETIKHVVDVIKTYGKLCSFSPCIEQVQKCTEAMADQGFIGIKTYECLTRNFDVQPVTLESLAKKEKVEQQPTPEPSTNKKAKNPETKYYAQPFTTERGHTGYLTISTFAGK